MATVRDLRELVSVSRLTFHEDDDDNNYDDDDNNNNNNKDVYNSENTADFTARTTLFDPTDLNSNYPINNKFCLPATFVDKNISTLKEAPNLDQLFLYIDASVVSDWLNRSNLILKKINNWYTTGNSNLVNYNKQTKQNKNKNKQN
jgi:hypothetical protein